MEIDAIVEDWVLMLTTPNDFRSSFSGSASSFVANEANLV